MVCGSVKVVLLSRLKSKINGDTHLKEMLTGSAVTFILKMSGMFLGYLVMLIISRQYGAEGIGVYNLTFSVMTFFVMFAAMGMNISILRYVGQFNKRGEEHKLKLLYRYVVEITTPLSLLLAVLLYFLAGVIADNLFHNPVYKPALEFVAFIVPFMTLQNVSVEFIRGLKNLKVSEFLRSVNSPVINIVLLLIIGLFVVDPLLPLYTLGVGIIVGAIFAFYFIVTRLKKIGPNVSNGFSKKEMVRVSIPIMMTVVATFALGSIPLFMLEVFSTTKDVGVFSVAFKIASVVSLSLVVVNTISAPKFSEIYWNKKYNELQRVISMSTRLIFMVSLISSILIALFSEQILILFGEDFISGSRILILLLVAQLINSATGSVSVLLNMTGSQIALKNIAIITTVLTIVVSYILVSNFGSIGAAYTFIFSIALLNISGAMYAHMKLGYITYYNPLNFKISKNFERRKYG